jgi:pyruvate dehydrogenase E2 component (dihydrolipoamide acetyltransferase)
MASAVLMPKLGATMQSGTIIRWCKQEGEAVLAGEPLVEIMTDKINMEIEADVSGHVLKTLFAPDDVVDVQVPIAYIGQIGEVVEETPAHQQTQLASGEQEAILLGSQTDGGIGLKVRATPAARKLARVEGINLKFAQGSGPHGRIHVMDVKQYLNQLKAAPRVTPLAQKIAHQENVDLSQISGSGVGGKIVRDDVLKSLPEKVVSGQYEDKPVRKIKLEGIRKMVAQRMVQNAFSAPHVTLVSEVDMSKVMEIRQQLIPVIQKQTDLRLSLTEILIKITAYVLNKHPMVNASLVDDHIILNSHINIGMAVAINNGLMVPVIKDADQKGLQTLTTECKNITKQAREGKLKPDQVSSGTFTISNLGMYAVDAFTPIINSPETAILGVGRINEKPVGVDGKIELRPMMTLSLSFDHRVIDGAPAAAFLTELKETLEKPYVLMV